jgi:hypothetical protein
LDTEPHFEPETGGRRRFYASRCHWWRNILPSLQVGEQSPEYGMETADLHCQNKFKSQPPAVRSDVQHLSEILKDQLLSLIRKGVWC